MLAIAPADADSASAGLVVKQGGVTDYGAPWRSIGRDNPRPVVTGDEILLFFKGIGPGAAYANRVIALVRTPIDRPAGPNAIHTGGNYVESFSGQLAANEAPNPNAPVKQGSP